MTGSDARARRATGASRGQASVLGVVLIVGLTVLGVTGILIFGSQSLENAQSQSEIDAAEHAMTQLDSRFSIVALGTASHQSSTVALPSGASLAIDEDRGYMNVSVLNRSNDNLRFEVFNETLGALVYENDGTTIAYQGGGVWKRAPTGGSVMVSPPEFHYRSSGSDDATLTLPLVVLRGSGSITGDAAVTRDATVSEYPEVGNADRSNPLANGKINVTVHSEFYRAWGAFFEDRTGGTVSYNHDRELVFIELLAESGNQQVPGGIVSGSAEVLTFGQNAVVDSYNSSAGPYGTGQQNTTIVAAGSVEMGQGAEIKGDVETGESLLFTGGSGQRVYGNLTYGKDPPSDPSKIDGWIESGADVESPSDVGWLITARGEEFDDSNQNGDDDITGRAIDCSDPCDLDAGAYYLDSLDLDNNDELVLDTSSGPVEIYVDGDVTVDKSSESITVNGNNPARLYVNQDFTLEKGTIEIPGNKSPRFWVYMRSGAVAHFHQAHFEGVIYGPGSGAQTGVDIEVKSGNEIFGGLVGKPASSGGNPGGSNSLSIGQDDKVHFDEALAQEDPLGPYGGNLPAVTYMHVSVNRVNVSSR